MLSSDGLVLITVHSSHIHNACGSTRNVQYSMLPGWLLKAGTAAVLTNTHTFERCCCLLPGWLQGLAVAAPWGVELRAVGEREGDRVSAA
jgi:hypothetical protein